MNRQALLEREAAELRATLESIGVMAESQDAPRKVGLMRQAIAKGLDVANDLQALRLRQTEAPREVAEGKTNEQAI